MYFYCLSFSCPLLSRYCPPPNSRRSQPPWVRHIKSRREAWQQKQKEEEELTEYLSSLEAKRKYPSYVIEALRNMDHDMINMDLMLELIKVICRTHGPGAILVFLPGWDTISKLHDMLRADPVFRSSSYLIIPLHSLMPTSLQQSVGYCRLTVHACHVHMCTLAVQYVHVCTHTCNICIFVGAVGTRQHTHWYVHVHVPVYVSFVLTSMDLGVPTPQSLGYTCTHMYTHVFINPQPCIYIYVYT